MDFLEIPLYDHDLLTLLVRLLLNLGVLFLLVKLAIRPKIQAREFAFSVVLMNITVFFICFALKKLELGLGMALGLFAIFGVLRYRAEAITTKEMTYLFMAIAIAVINALSNQKTSYAELLVINFIILLAALVKQSPYFHFLFFSAAKSSDASVTVAEKSNRKKDKPVADTSMGATAVAEDKSRPNKKNPESKPKLNVIYDRLEWLGPAQQNLLLDDLRLRTGLPIQRFRIQDIDLRNQTATITVWIAEYEPPVSS